MKIPIIHEKEVTTVADVVAELMKLDQSALVENGWPDEDAQAVLTIRRDEDTGRISMEMKA